MKVASAVCLHDQAESSGLQRALKTRHMGMIAIGSCLGMGLFLASGSAIAGAGPSLLLTYLVASGAVFLVLRALGELLIYRPMSGSFVSAAEEFLGSCIGFVTGWAYWAMNLIVGIAQVTAAGILANYWYPWVPQWSTALVALVTLYLLPPEKSGCRSAV